MARRIFQGTDVPLYMLSFLTGFIIFVLKLATVTKVLSEIGMNFYPFLMLLQGVSLYIGVKATDAFSRNYPFQFGLTVYLGGFLLVTLGHYDFPIPDSISLFASVSYFLFTSLLLSLIEVSMSSVIFSQVSFFKNPQMNTYLTLAEEGGAFVGAISIFLSGYFLLEDYTVMIKLAPFLIGLIILNALRTKDTKKVTTPKKTLPSENTGLRNYPFAFLLVGLFVTLLSIKHLQGFTVMLGLEQLSHSGSKDISQIFSKYSMLQNLFIVGVLLVLLANKKRMPAWNKGVRFYLIIQIASMVAMAFFPLPTLLLGASALRKICQHTFLEESINHLNSSIPKEVRLRLKTLLEGFGNLISYSILASVSYLYLNDYIPEWSALGIIGIIGGIGLVIRKRLFDMLTDFHIGSIVRSDIYEAVNSCYALANSEASKYVMALTSLLNRKPRPILQKAIIKSLSCMNSPEVIPTLMGIYETSRKEDVQLTAIDGLLRFKSHDIDYFLLKSLGAIVKEQTSLGELRRSLFTAITSRLSHVAIPSLLGILKENPEDQRIIANVLIVMGEVAKKRNDLALYEKMSHYLSEQYSRRVRANAIMYLYHHKKFHVKASGVFGTFLASNDEFDRSAVAFLSGELRLKGMLGFVLENSKAHNHKNSTLLMALLKLGHSDASYLYADLILHAQEDVRDVALNQLSALNNNSTRYQVYFQVMRNFPGRVNDLLQFLAESNRDYDEDRFLIHREAKNLGLLVAEDNQIFEVNSVPLKAA